MIHTLFIQNFLSIGNAQTLSFEATSDKNGLDDLTVEVRPGVRLLRLILFFGANASGKSNILKAIDTLWKMMFYPQIEEHNLIGLYTPFATHSNEPTVLGMTFWAMGRKFKYTLEYDEKEVISEQLMYTTDSGVMSKLYERSREKGITLGGTVAAKAQERNNLKAYTLRNHTVLSTFNKLNIDIPILKSLHEWIGQCVHQSDSHDNVKAIAKEAMENPELKSLIIRMLNKADFNISDFDIVKTHVAIPYALCESMPDEELLQRIRREQYSGNELIFTHTTDDSTFRISSNFESRGTLMYFRLAHMLYDLRHNESICIKDEIEDSLHYDLLVHYLKLFLETESRNQLICSSHTLPLLSEEWMIRRDMIWFTEKNAHTSETEIRNASTYGLHKNVSLENAYRIGKMGAQPNIGSTLIWGE